MNSPPLFPDDFSLILGGDSGFRLARSRNDRWWWINPAGFPEVVCGIQGMNASIGSAPADVQAQGMGFNLLVPPVGPSFCGGGMPYLHDLQLSRTGPPAISEDGVTLPDVFNPLWAEAVEQTLNALIATPLLAGWLGDGELKWGAAGGADEAGSRPGLLQICLGLDPAYRTYHSAWEFVLARHGGELAQVADAWGQELSSRGAVRQLTRDEKVFGGANYHADLEAFTAEFAERYFSAIRAAASQVNAGCLLFSPTLHPHTPAAVAAAARRHCDAALVTQLGLASANGPEILVQQHWRDLPIRPNHAAGESDLEAMVCEGRRHLVAAISRPTTLGYAWSPFRRGDLSIDLPTSAGLFDDNGRENGVFSLPLSALNSAALGIRIAADAPVVHS